MRLRIWCGLILMAAAGWAADLFRDNFSGYPPGLLSQPLGQLNGAIQEYHYIEHRGVRTHPWRNPIVHLDSWVISDEEGKPYLEQHQVNESPGRTTPLFVTGDAEWGDYTVAASVRPLSLSDLAGVVFRYHTSRHYYLFALRNGKEAVLLVRTPIEKELRNAEWRQIAAAPFEYDVRHYYRLEVENKGPAIRASIDGKQVLNGSDGEILKGQAGVMANVPARFQDFAVTAADSV
ncbi:MAG: hypothetical protein ACRD7E_14055, partial [Bryobacteraceae bacterium]